MKVFSIAKGFYWLSKHVPSELSQKEVDLKQVPTFILNWITSDGGGDVKSQYLSNDSTTLGRTPFIRYLS